MKKYILSVFIIILFLNIDKSFGQIAATYERAEKLSLQAASKYDAIGCTESANYCRKMASWNRCMINALAGKSNSCGIEPTRENAPYCDEAQMGYNGSNTGGNSSSKRSNPIEDMEYKQQQMQQEFSNGISAADNAYQAAIANGKKGSGAMVDATIAGSSQISDPKTSLAFTGIGFAASIISYISEKKEAQRLATLQRENEERARKLEELKAMKESLKISSSVFNFMSYYNTQYHYTNLKIIFKHGMVKTISRKDLYDVNLKIHKIVNTFNTICIYESISFRNRKTEIDSCVVTKISIPIYQIKDVQLYNGDITNAYNPRSNIDQIFRQQNLTNEKIQQAFEVTMYNEENDIGEIHSNLIDINISTFSNLVMIQRKYLASEPQILNDSDFDGIVPLSTNNYLLTFDDSKEYICQKFVDYLNYILK